MDQLSSRARDLVEAMRSVDPPRRVDRERVRQALSLSVVGSALGVTAAAGASEAVAVSSALSVGKVSLLVLAGALGGGAVLTPIALHRSEAPERPAASSVRVAPTSPTRPSSAPEKRVIAVAPSVAAVEPPPAPRAMSQSTPPLARTAPVLAPQDTLAQERRLLEAARERLRSGRSDDGLALIDKLEIEFPRGALREEAAATRILLLCAAGRNSEAVSARAAFTQAFPRSPLELSVERACARSSR